LHDGGGSVDPASNGVGATEPSSNDEVGLAPSGGGAPASVGVHCSSRQSGSVVSSHAAAIASNVTRGNDNDANAIFEVTVRM
jgi:hypothetical protein